MFTATVLINRAVQHAAVEHPVTGLTLRSDEPTCVITDATFSSAAPFKVRLEWPNTPEQVRLAVDDETFTIWPEMITARFPILLRRSDIIITTGSDERDYVGILESIETRAGLDALTAMATEPEDSFAAASGRNRTLSSPTWLGLGRDMRTFGMSLRGVGAGTGDERMWDWIAPQWHGESVQLDESRGDPVRYQFMVGRGVGPDDKVARRLDEGTLPILHSAIRDGGIRYDITAFVTLENSELSDDTNTGSNYLHADGHSAGHMFTPEQQAAFDVLETGPIPSEETVIFLQVIATNIEVTPRFAYLKVPAPFVPGRTHVPLEYTYDPQSGHAAYSPDRVFSTNEIDGAPLPSEEMTRLLQPTQSTIFDIRLPHRPISADRANQLATRDFGEALEQCRSFWRAKLDKAATTSLPEPRLDEMVRAGLLHLDLVAYGEEPNGTIAPTIGIYAPIGSESAPIIQFFDSMGRHDLARRSLQYFIDKQHADGFMQNFGGYMLETEAALWSFGEHYRYTRDEAWVKEILPNLIAAVEYVLRNRAQQQLAEDNPYGLILGKTADPEDPFSSFMLNGFAYLGLSRAGEMVTQVEPGLAAEWDAAARSLRSDIRAAFKESVGRSPVVPLGDGGWVRTAPPWFGHPGPLVLDRGNHRWLTHGSMAGRDSMLGPLWLIFQEVLDPDEVLSSDLLRYHSELFHHDNAAFSQPYYSPHPLTHLRRGEVNAFLRAYYTMIATLADPETYSFWEHYFHASPHKTHEEAWFLMQTRWMLYLEDGDELQLFPGIPRAWLTPGKEIRLNGVRSYFGPFDVSVTVSPGGNRMQVSYASEPSRAPRRVRVRLPHPTQRRARSTSVGQYLPEDEIIAVEPHDGKAEITVEF